MSSKRIKEHMKLGDILIRNTLGMYPWLRGGEQWDRISVECITLKMVES